MTHFPAELSGGEKQRTAIARALINQPKILLCDEPTGNLDSKNRNDILQLLKELQEDGLTILFVTHDTEVAKAGDRVFFMKDGRLMETDNSHGQELVLSDGETGR
nr:ATP-binding cassette domain-containing protein [Evansella caseinilytica]